MIRALVLYEGRAPDPERYRRHVDDFCSKVPGATFRHGGIFGAAAGDPQFAYYAEFEWPDMDSFRGASRSDTFAATATDAMEMGIPFTVHFAEVVEVE
jgi:hypothetical protein